MFWLPYKYEFKVANINLHDYDSTKNVLTIKCFFTLFTKKVTANNHCLFGIQPNYNFNSLRSTQNIPANIQLSNMNYFSVVNAHLIHQTLSEDPIYVSWQVVIYIYYYYLLNHTWPLSDKYYFQ